MKIKNFLRLFNVYFNYLTRKIECDYPPSRIWIEVTNHCNLQCRLCPNREIPYSKKGYMDFGLFKKIAGQALAAGVKDIYLFHRGEPLLHPGLFEMIDYLKKKKKDIKVMIHTNATLLDKSTSEKVLDSGLDFISFSFDGYMKETYEKNRVNSSYEKTLENIIDFLKLKKSRKKNKPFTVLQVMEYDDKCSRKDFLEQKKSFLKKFKNLSLDRFSTRKPHNWGGLIEINTCGRIKGNEGSRSGATINMTGNEHAKNNKKYVPCTFLWYGLVFLYDGRILPCPQDFNEKLVLGMSNDISLDAAFNNEEIKKIRRKIASGPGQIEKLQPCNRCDRLWRKTFLGVPVDYLSPFLKDNLGI